MKFVILTGMSGAGKSTALKIMEDIGYFCVDNLPIVLIEKFAELADMPGAELQKVAVGVDIRSGQALDNLQGILDHLAATGKSFEILYLDSTDQVLVKRYKETRHLHPLAGGERVDKGIQKERQRMAFLRKRADYIIDTSNMLTRELKAELEKIFVRNQDYKSLFVTVVSFGFKYGIPTDADLVFDVRFLPNPYYVEALRPKTGNDREIQEFVMGFKEAGQFLEKLEDMVKFLISNYITEGKTQLVIGIGCTGGKHRSVTLANALYQQLRQEEAYGVKIEHRDIGKDALRNK